MGKPSREPVTGRIEEPLFREMVDAIHTRDYEERKTRVEAIVKKNEGQPNYKEIRACATIMLGIGDYLIGE
jgi:hypothetical protein